MIHRSLRAGVPLMGPGRILEDGCNALEPDFMPLAADVQMPLTRTGTMGNLRVRVVCQNSTDLSSGQWIFTVENTPNGSSAALATSITCPFSSLVGASAPFIGICQDTSHSATFNAGDQISIKTTPSGTLNDDTCVVGGAVVEFAPHRSFLVPYEVGQVSLFWTVLTPLTAATTDATYLALVRDPTVPSIVTLP